MEKELFVKWKIRSTETARILKLLPALAEQTKKEKGNIFYSIYQSGSDPNEFIFHERYADEHAAESHKKSEHYLKIIAEQIIPYLEVREVTVVTKIF
jgi:quinol monooxygenase YgiN